MIAKTTASIAAENSFAAPAALHGAYNFSLSGTWSATVHLQRSFDGGATWLDVQALSANAELGWAASPSAACSTASASRPAATPRAPSRGD